MDAQVRDPSDADKHVSFYTKDVRVKEADDGDDEATRIEVPVSGLAEDRDGDKLADAAIDSMVAQINGEKGVPMFLNHGYDHENGVPQAYRIEHQVGEWVAAERDGDVVNAEARLKEDDEQAAAVVDLLDQQFTVGFSIGFGWNEGDAEERDAGGLRFDDMDLMEISAVGIQSHPDAATSDGLKVASALHEAGVDPAGIDETKLANALMSTKEEDEDDEEEEQNAGGGGATHKLSGEEMESIMNLIDGHMETLKEDIRDAVEVTDGGEESEEGDMDDDEDEETDEYGEDDDEDDKAAELEKELEEVRAELEAVKTDAAGSAGRKGGIETTASETKDGEGEDKGDTEEPTNTRAASVADQAALFD